MKFCHNCSSYYHFSRECPEPIISCGLILMKLPYYKKINIKNYSKINNLKVKNIDKVSKYLNKIKFLLVRRKHSYSFIEFVRGKYIIDKEFLTNLFELMCPQEIALIASLEFKKLWQHLWQKSSWYKSFEKELIESEKKFYQLKNNKELFYYLTNEIIPIYNTPEWGLPKGRREKNENNLECGIREFCEETSLTENNFNICDNISPMSENYKGTSNKRYKSIFYLATLNKNKFKFNIKDNYETGDIGFFTFNEAIELIRDYYPERIKILEKVFLFVVNYLEENKTIKHNKENIKNSILLTQ